MENPFIGPDGQDYYSVEDLAAAREDHFRETHYYKSLVLGREYPPTREGYEQMRKDESAHYDRPRNREARDMGFEGGGRFEGRSTPGFGRRRPLEDPFERGIEARGNRGIEDAAERENPSWLSEFINPAKLEKFKQYPAFEGHTSEWIIMDALLAILVEQGPEMDPTVRARLRNLVGILRMAFYPNMNPREQEFIHDLVTKTTTVDFSALRYEITSETREDIQWIWGTFGLEIPSR